MKPMRRRFELINCNAEFDSTAIPDKAQVPYLSVHDIALISEYWASAELFQRGFATKKIYRSLWSSFTCLWQVV